MNTGTNYADLFYSNIVNDVESLEKNVKEFPFSSVARFLHLYHCKKNNNPAFENLAKQIGIYINNPFWINYQLAKIYDNSFSKEEPSQSEILNKNDEDNVPIAVEEQIIQIPISENKVANESEMKNNSSEEEKQNGKAEENIPITVEEAGLPAGGQITQIPVSENEVANESEMINNSSEGEKQNEKAEENIPVTVEEADLPAGRQITQIPVSENEVTDESEMTNNSSEGEKQNEKVEENIPVSVEEPDLPAGRQITQIPVSENKVTDESEMTNNSFEEERQNEKTEENIPIAVDEPGLPAGGQIMQTPVSEHEIKEEHSESKAFESEMNVSENNEEDLIPFEPLHTVDYFASQGIKISEEALENDHLGKQLKSFTAWLKSMKKLHPGQLPEQNEVIEKIIQANAEISNQNANVLTEAMAEVLIKQNKKEKAIEMYQKLSLINPSKSAYFAAKIESLKIV